MRRLDTKFHIDGDQIIKTSSNELVSESEPLFLLRARDRLSLALLEHYRYLCMLDECNDYQMNGIDSVIQDFKQFRETNPDQIKQPARGLPYRRNDHK